MIETAGYEEVSFRPASLQLRGRQRVPSGFIYYGGNGKVYERTTYSDYEFNSHGDWVKRKETTEETLNRKSISWMLRKIEYYPL